jgi:hypothetical protein
VTHDTLKITTIYTQNDSGQTVFLYIYTIFKNPHTLGPIPVPTETKTSNPMQSYTVARGEWK